MKLWPCNIYITNIIIIKNEIKIEFSFDQQIEKDKHKLKIFFIINYIIFGNVCYLNS